MTRFPRDTILGLLAAAALGLAPASVALAVGPEAEGRQALLAWIRFVDGEETYADVPYFWLGKVDLRLQIDVKPGAGHVLELLWGSKNDTREAVATVNGKDVRITGGGYDGFRWLSVPVPPGAIGPRYEITLRKGSRKPAFLAEVRLTESGAADCQPAPDPEKPAWKIACNTAPPTPPEAYREAVRDVLSNLTGHLTDYHWGSADEYADSIEGAINLYNRERVESATEWIDSEIRDMWSVQQPDGVVEGWHGDGNSARTAIMYALWKTQGLTVQPWRTDVRLGAVQHGDGLCVSLIAGEPWSGKLVFDKPRHKLQMHLPIDYPRINQFPEWFTQRPTGSTRLPTSTPARRLPSPAAGSKPGCPCKSSPEGSCG